MPKRDTPLCAGEYYHLYNRGNNRERIFYERENYLFFLRRVRAYVVPAINVVAYCLMPTHYHLLVRVKQQTPEQQTPEVWQTSGVYHAPTSMMRISVSYTKAMNKRYERVGSLFQGAFQAKHVDQDWYLVHLSAYIRLNPVAAELVDRAEAWEFSSYREFIGTRRGTLPAPWPILTHFPSREAYQYYVEAWAPPEGEVIAHLLFD